MRTQLPHAFAAAVVAVIMLATAGASSAAAATFSVNPTQIFLARRSSSALLTLRNESDQVLRFELSVFAWSQTASGEMTLEPTQDVVFFPSLLTLKPSETRRVRVGYVKEAGALEKTYRIFVKELPPVDSRDSAGVRVLTTMGIPIFVRPAKEVATATLDGLKHEGGRFQFALANTGTVHFVPTKIRVRGLAGGEAVFDREVDGWYVLASGRREFAVPLPAPDCKRVTAVLVNVDIASETLEERLQTPGGACAP
jgi:fimbrial chaperone protein